MNAAFEAWWLEQTLKGDPHRNPTLVWEAFQAGVRSGLGGRATPNKLREAAQAVVDAWDPHDATGGCLTRVIADLGAALSTQPVQAQGEAMAYIQHHKGGDNLVWDDPGGKKTPLYTHPDPAVDRGLSEAMEVLDSIDDYIARINGDDRGSCGLVNELRSMLTRPALAASAPSQAEPATVPREKYETLLAQEHALSDSYVRLRRILGAMNPPSLTDSQALFAYVETVARKVVGGAPSQAGSCQASDEWATVEVNQGFPALMEALDRAARKGYMPDSMTAEWEAFEYRLPFSGEVAAPPAGRTLTDEEISRCYYESFDGEIPSTHKFARAILAASSTTAGERE